MKLLLIFAAILAFSLAEEEKKTELVEDSQAEASADVELMKEGADLAAAASTYEAYVPPSQRPPHWNAPNYVPPQNSWQPPKPIQPVHTGVPANVQSDYYDPHHHHPVYHPPTTTTPVSVIKNEQYYGENGHYRYEYKIADGTWVGEEGYYTDPKQTEESLVKKGWYSFVGADGKTYTTTYWADYTGFHAYGDHLPTPPPPYQPPQHHDEYPTQTQAPVKYPTPTPAPVHYPSKAPYVPPQQQGPYVPPPQAPYVPPQQAPYVPPQQAPYVPPQQAPYVPPAQAPYVPPQPTYQPYYPPQQDSYPQHTHNHV